MSPTYRNWKIRTNVGDVQEPEADSDRCGSSVRGFRVIRCSRGSEARTHPSHLDRASRQDSSNCEVCRDRAQRIPNRGCPATAMRRQQKAVELVREARAELLMKGSLHTDELMMAVVSRDGGLRTERRISHVFVMDVPTYHKVLIGYGRRDQYLSHVGRQGGHLPERDRSRPLARYQKT